MGDTANTFAPGSIIGTGSSEGFFPDEDTDLSGCTDVYKPLSAQTSTASKEPMPATAYIQQTAVSADGEDSLLPGASEMDTIALLNGESDVTPEQSLPCASLEADSMDAEPPADTRQTSCPSVLSFPCSHEGDTAIHLAAAADLDVNHNEAGNPEALQTDSIHLYGPNSMEINYEDHGQEMTEGQSTRLPSNSDINELYEHQTSEYVELYVDDDSKNHAQLSSSSSDGAEEHGDTGVEDTHEFREDGLLEDEQIVGYAEMVTDLLSNNILTQHLSEDQSEGATPSGDCSTAGTCNNLAKPVSNLPHIAEGAAELAVERRIEL